MNIFISESDRQNAFRVALLNIAKFYNVANYEFDDNQVLYKKLRILNVPIFKKLNEYLKAYDNWFLFYQRIKKIEEQNNEEHELTTEERSEIAYLIQKRKDSLEALQKEFDQLQFDRFKKQNGPGNVDGLILEDTI